MLQPKPRLPTVYERRQTGAAPNAKGVIEPVYTTYHIGHGQQLARKRLAAQITTQPPQPILALGTEFSRQHSRQNARAEATVTERLGKVQAHKLGRMDMQARKRAREAARKAAKL